MKRTWTCVQTIHHSLSLFALSPLKQHFGLDELNLNGNRLAILVVCAQSLVGGRVGSVGNVRAHVFSLSFPLSSTS